VKKDRRQPVEPVQAERFLLPQAGGSEQGEEQALRQAQQRAQDASPVLSRISEARQGQEWQQLRQPTLPYWRAEQRRQNVFG